MCPVKKPLGFLCQIQPIFYDNIVCCILFYCINSTIFYVQLSKYRRNIYNYNYKNVLQKKRLKNKIIIYYIFIENQLRPLLLITCTRI